MRFERDYYVHYTVEGKSDTSGYPTPEQMDRFIQQNIGKEGVKMWSEVFEKSIAGLIYKQVYDKTSELNLMIENQRKRYSDSINEEYDFLTGYRIKDFLSNLLKNHSHKFYPEVFTINYKDTHKTKVGVFVFEDESKFFVCNVNNSKTEGCPFTVGLIVWTGDSYLL